MGTSSAAPPMRKSVDENRPSAKALVQQDYLSQKDTPGALRGHYPFCAMTAGNDAYAAVA